MTLFFLLNVTLSLLNRWALGIQGFSFPMFLTMFQALFTFCCVLIAMIFSPTMTGDLRRLAQEEWKGILAVGFWMSLNIALNNYSLVHISLSLNQVLRYGAVLCLNVPCHMCCV